MRFEWNDVKNRINIRKHGIDFNDIVGMFNHEMLSSLDLRKNYGEERWVGIGWLKSLLGVVVYVEKHDDIIRIMSARKATKYEVKRYENTSKTDWDRLNNMKDEDVDTSDIPELGDDFFKNAVLKTVTKKPITIRLDKDVLEWFKSQGQGYQSRINQLLRRYMETHQSN